MKKHNGHMNCIVKNMQETVELALTKQNSTPLLESTDNVSPMSVLEYLQTKGFSK